MFGGRGLKKPLVMATLLLSTMLALQLALPAFSAPSGSNEPTGYVGVDFIVSYDDNYAALHPDIAIVPTNDMTGELGVAGTIHTVWDEINEDTGVREIHHSMSKNGGATWTGEEGDFIISDPRVGKADENPGDAIDPSIAIDSMGRIHVVWAQMQADGTWEVHYTRSDDNGDTWTGPAYGDTMISFIDPEFQDAVEMSAPKIVAGVIPGVVQDYDMLHVVWSEYEPDRMQEVFYSRSGDAGATWSGQEKNQMISLFTEPGAGYARNPVISVSGETGEFVHASWIQKGDSGFDEVYYLRSNDHGMNWTSEEERPITQDVEDGVNANNLSISSYKHDVHMVWSQIGKEPGMENAGILYSGSNNDGDTWTSEGQSEETPINNNRADKNVAYNPAIITNEFGEAWAHWTELHERSMEIHVSYNQNPLEGHPWSAQEMEDDEIISNPDEENHAQNVTAALDWLPDGTMRPQVVWDEPNPDEKLTVGKSGQLPLASKQEHEIHYNPDTPTWTLSTSTSGSGSIVKDPNQSSYTDGTTVKVTANPNPGWSFSGWSGDLSGITNPEYILMDSDKSITATFTEDQYTLTITTSGSGSVYKNPNQSTYTYGTTVQLTADPDPGWEFDHWDGDLTGTTNPDSLTIYSNSAVTANFTQITEDITISSSGWHLVSLPLVQTDTSISTVLSSINGNYDIVKYYDSADKSDPWKTYKPGWSGSDLTDLDHKMAFWLHTTASCTLTVYGDYPVTTNITLRPGWNFVGFPSSTSDTADSSLSGTGADWVAVYNGTRPSYVEDTTDLADVTFVKGNGYWVHVPALTYWIVNW